MSERRYRQSMLSMLLTAGRISRYEYDAIKAEAASPAALDVEPFAEVLRAWDRWWIGDPPWSAGDNPWNANFYRLKDAVIRASEALARLTAEQEEGE